MRYDNEYKNWALKETVVTNGKKTEYPRAGEFISVRGIRNDIVSNPVISGWRKPSKYAANFTDTMPLHVLWSGTYRDGTNVITREVVGSYPGPTWTGQLPPVQSSIEQMLLSAASQRLKQESVNLAVAFAERRKTAALLGQTAMKLLQAYRLARTGQWRELAQFLGFGSNYRYGSKLSARKWLELQYGWLPIVYDIYGLAAELARPDRNNGLLFKVGAAVRTEFQETATRAIAVPGTFGHTGTVYTNGTVDQKISLWYVVDSKGLAMASRLGLTNPALVAWELTPFSFVVDWLLPIGDLIDAQTAPIGFDFKGGSHTRFVNATQVGTLQPTPAKGYAQSGSVNVSLARRTMSRDTYTVSPKPKLRIKNPFSNAHVVTAVSLLRVLRRSY